MADTVQNAIGIELQGLPRKEGVPPDASPTNLDQLKLFGLAFSGGGIRSATFNLGVLQGLEKRRLLRFVDYLSTVSGGGYIGSWYVSCLKQKLGTGDERKPALDHLRRYSNYLAPETGFFSADTWTIAMVWLRNTLLLQTMLVSLFAFLLLSPRFLEWAFLRVPPSQSSLAALVLFAVAAIQIIHRLARMSGIDREPRSAKSADAQGLLQITIVLPLLVAAACFASCLWNTVTPAPAPVSWTLPLWAGGVVALATAFAVWFSLLYYVRRLHWGVWAVCIAGLCGGLFAALTYAIAKWYAGLAGLAGATWLAGLAGAPAMLAVLGLAVVLQIGLLGRAIDDSRREWWSRLGAFLAIYSLAALALGAAAVYSPWLAREGVQGAWKWLSGTVTLGGIATTLGGLIAARSRDTGGAGGNPAKEMLAKTAPFVFIAGLLILVSAGLHFVLAANTGCATGSVWQMLDCSIGPAHLGQLGLAAAITCLVLLLLAVCVDINEASMNPFYRNRLVRCYQGASRAARGQRRPNLFTGFDFADDYALGELSRNAGTYDGPVPILNTSLNLTGGENAALEERRATSFFFTPYHSGSNDTGCVETKDLGKFEKGIRLGSCVAASGAAVSPNMGFHTSAPVAFLMTFFNVRLGLWLGNPSVRLGKQRPRWGLWYLLKELFATADDKDRYVYLSDGGHFENLGVYELIRRRCRYIIACDAEQDEGLVLEGLGNLVRKARIDFGAEIVIDTSQIRQRDQNGRSQTHCAVGRIQYRDPQETGYLVYLKASLTGDEGSDVLQYKAQHAAFPHESTGDQFFSESQFESYRALGDHIVANAFAHQIEPRDRDDLEGLMQSMNEAWAPPSRYTEEHFARHAEQLNRLWDEIRKDPELAYLDRELFPERTKAGTAPPALEAVGRRRGLYLGQTILQLMENVYLDLHLDSESDHPDNTGWMTLFQTWAKSPLLQEAWGASQTTYGSRFQKFCERELGLPLKAKAAGQA